MKNSGGFWAGKWHLGQGEPFASIDPTTGNAIWQSNSASSKQIGQAYDAASKAGIDWARLPLEVRLSFVRAFQRQLEENKADFAKLISQETGKAHWESQAEVGAMIGKVELSITAYDERTGTKSMPTPFGSASLRHRPHGVLAVLGPYNFPCHLPNGHIIPALIAGDTLVFKPSELTPATGEFMCDLWQLAGLPDGVLNLVQGGRDVGAAVLDHSNLDGVLFTGSAITGAFIHKKFAGRPEVLLALEMGGNNPLVVWEAQDVEAVANLTVQSAFVTSGQRCTCARRLILPEGKAGDQIIEAIVGQIDRLNIAPWDQEPQPFSGSLISDQAARNVLRDQESHLKSGAKSIRLATTLPWSEAALCPSLLEMGETQVADEETFGPMVQIYRVSGFDQAIKLANQTRFGLAAGLISDDIRLWERFTNEIRAGIVNFNRPTTGAASSLPFGGPGISGNHRPGAWYAADYCAWPMASQEAPTPKWVDVPGLAK